MPVRADAASERVTRVDTVTAPTDFTFYAWLRADFTVASTKGLWDIINGSAIAREIFTSGSVAGRINLLVYNTAGVAANWRWTVDKWNPPTTTIWGFIAVTQVGTAEPKLYSAKLGTNLVPVLAAAPEVVAAPTGTQRTGSGHTLSYASLGNGATFPLLGDMGHVGFHSVALSLEELTEAMYRGHTPRGAVDSAAMWGITDAGVIVPNSGYTFSAGVTTVTEGPPVIPFSWGLGGGGHQGASPSDLAGSIDGIGVLSGDLELVPLELAGSIDGTSTLTGDLTNIFIVSAGSPSLAVEVDFTNDPTNATRVWTDITVDVRQLSYARAGRNNELQRTEPGTLSGILNNRHGYYDPENTASPYYPGVKRMRWCRVSATWAGVTYRRWTGLVEVWSQEWPAAGKDAIATIQAADAMKALNLFDLDNKSYGSQLTSARVSAILTDAGITSSSVATGQTTIVASGTMAPGSSALAHLQEVEESENGLIYAEGDGSIVFQDRHWRLLNSATSLGTIGDLAGDIPYRTGQLDLDDGSLWNTAVVTPSGGTEETATDATSKLAHYERRLTRSILTSSQTEALNAAQYLVQRYADQGSRIPAVELLGVRDTSKWPVILAAKNSDRFAWRRSASARTILENVYVERVADVVTPGRDWRVSLQLSPADEQAGWVLGDATFSLAGETTRAIY